MYNWNESLTDYLKDITPLIECFLTIGYTHKQIQDYFEFGEKLELKVLSQFPSEKHCRIQVPDMIPTVLII